MIAPATITTEPANAWPLLSDDALDLIADQLLALAERDEEDDADE
jgi:hypothetical protein